MRCDNYVLSICTCILYPYEIARSRKIILVFYPAKNSNLLWYNTDKINPTLGKIILARKNGLAFHQLHHV